MKRYSWLLLLIFFSCKKNEEESRINIRQQPSLIQVYDVNPLTLESTLQHSIHYAYNDSALRFDSIRIDNITYVFDYSKLSTENKILFNYTDAVSPFQEIQLDATNYTLLYYRERQDAATVLSSYKLQYDSINRIRSLSATLPNSADDYQQLFTSGKFDTVFIHSSRNADACNSRDTLAAGLTGLSTSLPYLLLLDAQPVCNTPSFNMLQALPISNFTYKLPTRLLNGNTEAIYTYKGDSKLRLAETLIMLKNRSDGSILSIRKIVLSY
jgi:hypothetical protein